MNIAITLPECLWSNIVSGKKTIELRKNYPKKFEEGIDSVFVILKGSRQVVGWFRVEWFEEITDVDRFSSHPAEGLCVSNVWVRKYLKDADKCYLWHIGDSCVFEMYKDYHMLFDLSAKPQSFVYICH